MHRILKKLEEMYNYPVEIEFTVNFTQYMNYKINLLQCRPLQTKGETARVNIPDNLPASSIIFKTIDNFMGGNISLKLRMIIYVDPYEYAQIPLSQRYEIARIIGKINRTICKRKDFPTLLLGPGRWGTTSPSLGVPVRFSEINNMAAIGEIAYMAANFIPELSFGTHFFQDLVETDIFYVALFPDDPQIAFNHEVLASLNEFPEDFLPLEAERYSKVIKVYDASNKDVYLMADICSQQLVCFIHKGTCLPHR